MAVWDYNATSPVSVLQGVNALTQGLFGPGILILLWLIIFIRNPEYPAQDRIVTANYITMVMSLSFAVLDLITGRILALIIVIFVASMALIINRN